MKKIIIATLAVFALSGTAMAANSQDEAAKEKATQTEKAPAKLNSIGDKSVENTNDPAHKLTPEEAAKKVDEEKLNSIGDKSVENTNDPEHKLTPEEAAKNPVEGVTPSGDGSPQE